VSEPIAPAGCVVQGGTGDGPGATTDAALLELGIVRIPIPVPFPQAGGPVNAYLLEEEGGGVALFDAGLGSPDGESALAEGFARAGRRFDEVTRIVLSHGHVDHYGAARTIQERASRELPVFAHAADAAKIAESGWRWRDRLPLYAAHFTRLGVPPDVLAEMGSHVGSGLRLARRVPDVRPLRDGESIRTRHLALEVLHLPGHTPGMLCLWEPRTRLLFSADHLLEKVSPNPLIELGPNGEDGAWRPLVAYLASLERVRALDVGLVLPGHGEPFGGHRAVIDGLVRFYGKRQARIRAVLAQGPRTGWDVTRALFPSVRAQDLFLAVSEAMANVEVLEAGGEVTRSLEEDVYRFRLL
jgi:glyoxylase-like metal-dependent hydrolase (beta-lactamase superfamily II)